MGVLLNFIAFEKKKKRSKNVENVDKKCWGKKFKTWGNKKTKMSTKAQKKHTTKTLIKTLEKNDKNVRNEQNIWKSNNSFKKDDQNVAWSTGKQPKGQPIAVGCWEVRKLVG